MKRIIAPMIFTIAAHAQSGGVSRGAEVFRTTCSVPYCHGSEGSAGRAPQLAGTALSTRDLVRVITAGTQAGMPGFGQKLSLEEIDAVAQYIRTLPAPAKPAAPAAKPGGGPPPAQPLPLPPAAEKGRALFFDAVRMGGCGSCHELDNHGSAVGPDLRTAAPGRNLRADSNGRWSRRVPPARSRFPQFSRIARRSACACMISAPRFPYCGRSERIEFG